MFDYVICTCANIDIYYKQCEALVKHIPNLIVGTELTDVDGTISREYLLDGKKILVYNSQFLDEVFIRSEIPLEPYFE